VTRRPGCAIDRIADLIPCLDDIEARIRAASGRRARGPRPSSDMLQVVKAFPTIASPTTAPLYRRPM